jgi:hypothetical protein
MFPSGVDCCFSELTLYRSPSKCVLSNIKWTLSSSRNLFSTAYTEHWHYDFYHVAVNLVGDFFYLFARAFYCCRLQGIYNIISFHNMLVGREVFKQFTYPDHGEFGRDDKFSLCLVIRQHWLYICTCIRHIQWIPICIIILNRCL